MSLMKMFKKLLITGLVSLTVAPLGAYEGHPNHIGDDVMPSNRIDIQLRGYFKDGNRNRIRTFSYEPGTEMFTIWNHAKQLQKTDVSVTEAYYYPADSRIPGNELTYSRNLRDTHFLLFGTEGLSSWRYVYRKEGNKEEFIDCGHNKRSLLCRDNHVIR